MKEARFITDLRQRTMVPSTESRADFRAGRNPEQQTGQEPERQAEREPDVASWAGWRAETSADLTAVRESYGAKAHASFFVGASAPSGPFGGWTKEAGWLPVCQWRRLHFTWSAP